MVLVRLYIYYSVKQVQILGGAVFYHPLYFKMTGQNCQYGSSAWCRKGPLKAPHEEHIDYGSAQPLNHAAVSGELKLGFFQRDPNQVTPTIKVNKRERTK